MNQTNTTLECERKDSQTQSSAWNCLVCLLLKHQFCKILMKHFDLNSNEKSANPKAAIWWKALKLKRRKFESSASWTFKNWTVFKKNVITLDFLTIKHCLLMPKACRSLQFACGDCEEGRKVSASSQKIPTETLGWLLGWKPKKRDVACWDLTTSQTSASTSEGSTQAGALVAPIRAPLRANSLSSWSII